MKPNMKKIYKYELNVTDTQTIEMPKGADILSIQFQGKSLCIWALVVPNEKSEERVFCIFGTGHDVSFTESLKFIETVQHFNGSMVWHIFEAI